MSKIWQLQAEASALELRRSLNRRGEQKGFSWRLTVAVALVLGREKGRRVGGLWLGSHWSKSSELEAGWL